MGNDFHDWQVKTLGEVCEVINGGTPKTKVEEFWNGNIAWITPADLGKLQNKEVKETTRTISEQGLKKSSAKLLPENSVILSTRAPIGHLAINKIPMATNQGCRGLIPHDKLNTVFLYYFLKLNVSLLNSLGTGTTFKELSNNVLKQIKISLPPLPEQKKIVAVLDKAFALMDKMKANLEKNIINAKELFQSKLQQIFSEQGKDWKVKTLGEVCDVSSGNSAPQNKQFFIDGIYPFIRTSDVGKIKKGFITSCIDYLNEKGIKKLKLFRKGTILFPKSGASTFLDHRVMMLIDGYVSSHLATIKASDKIVNDKYILYYLITIYAKDLIQDISYPSLKVSVIKQIKIPLPPLPEQKKIVTVLDKLREKTVQLEANYQKKLLNLVELKKVFLDKAFKGELIYQK